MEGLLNKQMKEILLLRKEKLYNIWKKDHKLEMILILTEIF